MKIRSNSFTGNRKNTSVYLTLVFVFLMISLGISITLAFFYDNDWGTGNISLSGKVAIEAVGENGVSIEDTETSSNLIVKIDENIGVLRPGDNISMIANCKVKQSTSSPLLRAKLDVELVDLNTNEVYQDDLYVAQDLYFQLAEVVKLNKWYFHTDSYFYYVGDVKQTSTGNSTLLSEVVVDEGDIIVDFINTTVKFPTTVDSTYSGLGFKVIITFQAIQDFIPDENGVKLPNTIANSYKIFNSFESDKLTQTPVSMFKITNNNGVVTISPKSGEKYPEAIVLPTSDEKGNQITHISSEFKENTQIKHITVPAGYKSIDTSAFENNSTIQSIDLSLSSITSIPARCFYTSSLTSIQLPETITTLEGSAFQNSGLTSLVLPEGLKRIESNALTMTKLQSLYIPASVSYIAEASIHSLLLTKIVVDENNPYYYDVNDCELINANGKFILLVMGYKNSSYSVPEGVSTIATHSIYYPNAIYHLDFPSTLQVIVTPSLPPNLRTVTFHENNVYFSSPTGQEIVDISSKTLIKFFYDSSKSSYEIPSIVTTIGDSSFQSSTSKNYLNELIISQNITSIATNAFLSSRISNFIVDLSNNYFYTDNNIALISKKGEFITYSYSYPSTTYTIPSSVTRIISYAFQKNTYLRTITLNNGLTYISSYSFYECSNLNRIENFSSKITLNTHFADYTSLEEFTVYNSVQRKTFESISTLKKVIFASNVTSVGEIVFSNCPALETVIFESEIPPVFASGTIHIGTTPNTFKIYVPDSAVEIYKAVANLSQYKDRIFGISQLT